MVLKLYGFVSAVTVYAKTVGMITATTLAYPWGLAFFDIASFVVQMEEKQFFLVAHKV
jgi:hypothetical protein